LKYFCRFRVIFTFLKSGNLSKQGIYFSSVLIAILVISSCSSGKKGGQSYAGRVYHNTTSHYNGYYYAKRKMTEVESQMAAAHKDDYTKLLPLYSYGNPDDPAQGAEMDSVIKQLTVVVKLHPESKWADDCFFNIGKAYYYKKDYNSALATFQYVSSEFKEKSSTSSSSSKKKKKKHKKPMTRSQREKEEEKAAAKGEQQSSSGSFLKHKPIRNTDLVWMIRTYANLKKYSDAEAIIAYLEDGKEISKELKYELALTKAYVDMAQKQYDKAIDPMKSAIGLTSSKKLETRYTYILAQLYQATGNYKIATQMFTEVTKLRPSYEMDFNARISVGKNYVQSGSGSAKEIIDILETMARDEKYEEFNDQIYYYIALVNLKQNKEDEAIRNLETSIKKSYVNPNQMGLSYLKIGELDFEAQEYLSAQPSYDSAAIFLDAKFDTIDRVKEIRQVLDNLVMQTHIVIREDSLQKLAKMSEKERNKIIDNTITQLERQKNIEAQDTILDFETQQAQQLPGNQESSGSWYFYNTSTKATGYSDFIKRWGNRANEDNWRRSNKKSDLGVAASGNEAEGDSTSAKTAQSNTSEDQTRAALLANIPLTPEKMAASNEKIFDAYYSIGTIYKDDLNNRTRAAETFERIASRFPDNKNIARVYYTLYLLYSESGNTAKADYFRGLLLQDHASSAFAMVIQDPEYLKKEEEKQHVLDNYYASTYDYFVAEMYPDVIQRAVKADSIFKPNPLEPKFDLLEAYVIGKTKTRDDYIAALDSLIKKYPSGEVHDKAVEILTVLGVPVAAPPKSLEGSKKEDKNAKGAAYQFRPNNPQYIVVVFTTISPKTKAISDSLANYNTMNHSLENLKVSSQLLDTKTQMIVVKQIKNKDLAMSYYYDLIESETMFEQVEEIGYDIFVIDDKNFPLFYQRKNVQEYLNFFTTNYEDDSEE
jgi:tetratricopeptide (TPR) repeat protein